MNPTIGILAGAAVSVPLVIRVVMIIENRLIRRQAEKDNASRKESERELVGASR